VRCFKIKQENIGGVEKFIIYEKGLFFYRKITGIYKSPFTYYENVYDAIKHVKHNTSGNIRLKVTYSVPRSDL